MILAATEANVGTSLISVLLGGGVVAAIGALVQLRKAKPEVEAIGITSMGTVATELRTEVIRQAGMIVQLREQNERYEEIIRRQDESLTRAEDRIRAMTRELSDLEATLDERGR